MGWTALLTQDLKQDSQQTNCEVGGGNTAVLQPFYPAGESLIHIELDAHKKQENATLPAIRLMDATLSDVVKEAVVTYEAEGFLNAQLDVTLDAEQAYVLWLDFSSCGEGEWSIETSALEDSNEFQMILQGNYEMSVLNLRAVYQEKNVFLCGVSGLAGALLLTTLFWRSIEALLLRTDKRMRAIWLRLKTVREPMRRYLGWLSSPAAVNLLILLVNLFLATPRFQTDDDWGIGNFFSGVKGDPDPNCPFVSILLGKFLCSLYELFPEIQWNLFGLYEYTLIFFSFWILLRYTKKKSTNSMLWGASVLMLALLSPQFYILVQFTKTAALACFAAVLGLADTVEDWNAHKGVHVAFRAAAFTFFFFLGFSLRPACALMSFPFFMFTVLKQIFSAGTIRDVMLRIAKYAAVFAGAFFVLIAGNWYQDIYYQNWDSGYLEFNSARAGFLDYEKVQYAQIQEELTELGVSENDYQLLCGWMLEDTEFITTDLLKSLADLQPKQTPEENLADFFFDYTSFIDIPLFLFAVFTGLLLLANEDFPRAGVCAGLLLVANAAGLFFAVQGRFPSYVRFPFYFIMGVVIWCQCLLPFAAGKRKQIGRRHAVWIYCLLLACLAGGFGQDCLSACGEKYLDDSGEKAYSVLNEREERIYLMGSSSGMPGLRESYGVFLRATPGIYSNIVSLGGWSSRHPLTTAQYERLGISNPMQELDKANVYVLTGAGYEEKYRIYFEEHTHKEVFYSVTEELDGVKVFAYRTNFESLPSDIQACVLNVETTAADDENLFSVSIRLDRPLDREKVYYIEWTETLTGRRQTYECGFSAAFDDELWLAVPSTDFILETEYEMKVIEVDQDGEACYYTGDFTVRF